MQVPDQRIDKINEDSSKPKKEKTYLKKESPYADIFRKAGRFVHSIQKKFYDDQMCYEWDIRQKLRSFDLTNERSQTIAINFLVQQGIMKRIDVYPEDEITGQKVKRQAFMMKIYSRGVEAMKKQYPLIGPQRRLDPYLK